MFSNKYTFKQQNLVDVLQFTLKNDTSRFSASRYFLQKSLYWYLSLDTPFPSKWSCPPTNGFTQFFQGKLMNIHEVLLLESILIRKKILRWINFVLIKFSLNALLFEKLQNECKNPLSLYKVTSIGSDHAGVVAKYHIHGLEL